MDSKKILKRAILQVRDYENLNSKIGESAITEDDVFVVWSCKTLQHYKAILSTTKPNDMLYEYTYNGDRDESFLDAYKKIENVCLKH